MFSLLDLNPSTILEIIGVICAGLIFGSFSTAMVYRMPRGIPLFAGGHNRSKCPHCGHQLGPLDLIPVLSWLLSKGRCRYCGAKIGWRYPAIELSVLVGCLVAYFTFGLMQGIAALLLIPVLVSLLFIDLDHKILPNVLVTSVAILAPLHFWLISGYEMSVFMQMLVQGGLSAVIYGLIPLLTGWIMQRLLRKEALGFGDVKFFAAAGLWLGLENLAIFCILAGILGVIFGIFWQKIRKEPRFPFGPALITAFFVVLLLSSSHLL